MSPLLILDGDTPPFFPDGVEPDANGLVALGGELDPPVLIEAYRKGVFPWSGEHPIPWFSPDPRCVLIPSELHVSRRLARRLRSREFSVSFDTCFADVMRCCAEAPGRDGGETWITGDMIPAYTRLHEMGLAHCVEIRRADDPTGPLVGGLYGVCLGRCFFGESMFSLESDASKAALYQLCVNLQHRGGRLVDCQQVTPHILRMGARPVPRKRFLRMLADALSEPGLGHSWTDWSEAPPP